MGKWLRSGVLGLLLLAATISVGCAMRHTGITDYLIAAAGLPMLYVAHRLSGTFDSSATRALGPGLRLAIAWLTTVCGLLFLIAGIALAVARPIGPASDLTREYVLVAGIAMATGLVAGVGLFVLRGKASAWAFSAAYVGAMLPLSLALDRYQRPFQTSDWVAGASVAGVLFALTARRTLSEARPTRESP